jgi:hypothetical protein
MVLSVAAVIAMMLSPGPSMLVNVGEVRVVSTKVIHPVFQLVAFEQVVPSALTHTVTRFPRLIASDFAWSKDVYKSLVVVVNRLDAIAPLKLGTASIIKMAKSDKVNINSIKVMPRELYRWDVGTCFIGLA